MGSRTTTVLHTFKLLLVLLLVPLALVNGVKLPVPFRITQIMELGLTFLRQTTKVSGSKVRMSKLEAAFATDCECAMNGEAYKTPTFTATTTTIKCFFSSFPRVLFQFRWLLLLLLLLGLLCVM